MPTNLELSAESRPIGRDSTDGTAAAATPSPAASRLRRLLMPVGAVVLAAGLLGVLAAHRADSTGTGALLTAPRDAAVSATGTRAEAVARAQARLRTAPKDWRGGGALRPPPGEQARGAPPPPRGPQAAGAGA